MINWQQTTDRHQIEACRQIWVGVILQATRDLMGIGAAGGERSTEHGIDARKAQSWLGSRDFHMTCSLAGLDAGKVEERLRALIARRDSGDPEVAVLMSMQGGAAAHRIRKMVP